MASARMIHRNVSLDERLAEQSLLARLLYTWGLPHTSDYGVLAAAPRRLKAQVMPLTDETPEEIEAARDELITAGLWLPWEHEGTAYIVYPTFDRYQRIDRRSGSPRDGVPIPPQDLHTIATTSQIVHSSGKSREVAGSENDCPSLDWQGKGREGKGIEGNTPPLPPPGGDCVLSPVDTSDDNALPEYSHYLLLNYPKLVGLIERLYADAWEPRKRLRTVLAYIGLLREPGCRLDEGALVAAWEADPPWPGTSAESYMRHLHGANARRLDAEDEPDARASPDRAELVARAKGLYRRLFTEDLLFSGNARQCEAIVAETYGPEVAAHAAEEHPE